MTQPWKNDAELFAIARKELFSAVVGDSMDKLGLIHQFLPPRIQPLARETLLVGRAMPVVTADLETPAANPFGLMFTALDDLKADEIYLSTGGSPSYALWGELMSIRALHCGAAGAVLEGFARDTHGILSLKFPVFSYGAYAQDQSVRGQVLDYRVPVQCGDVRIAPGDILIGDADGVCAVPQAAEVEVFCAAIEKARGEKALRQALEQGMTASAAFQKFGFL